MAATWSSHKRTCGDWKWIRPHRESVDQLRWGLLLRWQAVISFDHTSTHPLQTWRRRDRVDCPGPALDCQHDLAVDHSIISSFAMAPRSRIRTLAVAAALCALAAHGTMAENHGALRGLQGMMTDPPPVDMTRLPVTANATSKPTDAPDYDSIEDVATERKGLHVSPKPDQEDRAQEVEEASAEISTSGAGPSRDDKLGMSGIAGIVAGCVMCIGLAFAFVHVKRRRTPSIESDNRSDSTVGDSRYLETSNTPEQRAKAVNGASKADPRGTPSVRTRNVDGSMGVQNIHNQRLAKPLKTTRGANESPRGTGVMKSLRTESPFKDKCEVSNRTGRRTENYEFALDTRDCPILGSGDDIDESTREMAVLGGNPSQTGKK